ncbi:MAG: single-stranded DNA-binding protein [Nitrococcus sp.]|nr:single-stranded DNA-binding protein [Nitrococcus sp.]
MTYEPTDCHEAVIERQTADDGAYGQRNFRETRNTIAALTRLTRGLARELDALQWRSPSHVYNPLRYAWSGYQQYLQRFGAKRGRVLLLGMNPGPWGMAQTGVPFGNISAVRGWFHIETRLARKLPTQHPRYPILGMACGREEGSGQRLWKWAHERVGTPEQFFDRFFVWNYCPLLFLAKDRNLIPSALKVDERESMEALCGNALVRAVKLLDPVAIMAIGRYAEHRAQAVVGDARPVGYLLHPSPASPTANQHWPEFAERALGPWLPSRSAQA